MEAKFVDAVTNKPFKKWLTKIESIKVIIDVFAHYLYHGYFYLFINVSFLSWYQYCSLRVFLLVDIEDDLFKTFHLLAVKAIKIIAKHFYKTSNDEAKDNRFLNKWMSCEFCGEESFDDVTTSLNTNVRDIADYIGYLKKIPNLSKVISYKEVSKKNML